MWIFDANGKKTQATEEDAQQMVTVGGYSALWPKGTPAEEAAEFEALKNDLSPAEAITRASKRIVPPATPSVSQPAVPVEPRPVVSRSRTSRDAS